MGFAAGILGFGKPDAPGHGQLQRHILAVLQFYDTGQAHEIDPVAKIEITDNRRARKIEHADIGLVPHQVMCDRAAPSQMAETKLVVTVDQNTLVAVWHRRYQLWPGLDSRETITQLR